VDRFPHERTRADAEDEELAREVSEYAAVGWYAWKMAQDAAAAIAASKAILAKLASGRDDSFGQALEILDRQSRQVARLLDDLNDLSPIDHGKLALRLQRIELATVMTDAIQNILPRIERRRQRLLVSAPPAPVELQADPVRIVQVLANLLDNAAKYTPDRGEIRLAATVSAGTAQLSVRDTGVGIPRDKLTAIFDPFAQIAPADGGARPRAGAGRTTGEATRRDDSGVE